jgi:hypothetical protein
MRLDLHHDRLEPAHHANHRFVDAQHGLSFRPAPECAKAPPRRVERRPCQGCERADAREHRGKAAAREARP